MSAAGWTEERQQAAAYLAEAAPSIAAASLELAQRYAAGGRMLVAADGPRLPDAAHVAVEFVHPVIVGKRALPALSVACDDGGQGARRLDALARRDDLVLALLGPDAEPTRQMVKAAGALGLPVVGISRDDPAVDSGLTQLVALPAADDWVGKEMFVTTYHLLWELTHVFLDHLRSL